MENTPLVSVWMIAYNHEGFIKQALESVINQKTTFPFEVIIGEDCSTDGTRKIIQKFEEQYPQLIKPIYHEKNVGAIRNAYEFCYPRLKGKYIACLEADDYWTDPLKLQKQVDFLENNSEYSISWTKYQILEQNELSFPDWLPILQNKTMYELDLNNIFNPYCTYTLTALFKKSAFNATLFNKMKYGKDNTLYCICLSQGKGAVLNFFGGVYRVHSGGTYSSTTELNQYFSNFLNLREIISLIPGCKTENLIKFRNGLLIRCYYLACNNKFSSSKLKMLSKLYLYILKYLPLSNKINSFKELVKQAI